MGKTYPNDIWLNPKWEKRYEEVKRKTILAKNKYKEEKRVKPKTSILADLHII